MTSPIRKRISVVAPSYNEEGNVQELARRLRAVFEQEPAYEFEVLFVENGCVDSTLDRMLEIHRADPRFKIIRLSRNFRLEGGLTAGLEHATGDAAVIMAADLQDPPELISQFLRKWEEGYDNVYQVVSRRQGTSLLRRVNSQVFYWIVNALTGGMIPRNVSDFRLIDRRVYSTINGMRERNRMIRGLFAWAGFKSIGIEYERPPRFSGESHAHTLKVLSLAIRGILGYSYVPLRIITIVGLLVSLLSFVLLGAIVVKVVFWGVPFPGFGTIMSVMLLMFGVLFVVLGVLGEYLGLIYEEVKGRPNYVVKETWGITPPQRPAVP